MRTQVLLALGLPALMLAGCATDARVSSSSALNQTASVGERIPARSSGQIAAVAINRGEFLRLFNEYRRRNYLAPVQLHDGLNDAAVQMSFMTASAGKLKIRAHSNASLRRRLGKVGVQYMVAAENLAGNRETSSEVIDVWHRSVGHRRNMLIKDVTHIGIARVDNPNDRWKTYWTLILAQPREATPNHIIGYKRQTRVRAVQ